MMPRQPAERLTLMPGAKSGRVILGDESAMLHYAASSYARRGFFVEPVKPNFN